MGIMHVTLADSQTNVLFSLSVFVVQIRLTDEKLAKIRRITDEYRIAFSATIFLYEGFDLILYRSEGDPKYQ
jgi:hypothetical protein